MANKDSRAGGKYSGNHMTLTPTAALICDIAHKCSYVTKISPGFIKSGTGSTRGHRRVKIIDRKENILLAVTSNASHQEICIYTKNKHATKLAIARGARDNDIKICFSKIE